MTIDKTVYDLQTPSLRLRLPDLQAEFFNKENPAHSMMIRILEHVGLFQQRLSKDTELGLQVIGGGAPPFHLRQINSSNPDMLVFTGLDAHGNLIQLLQHHTQLSICFVGLRKLEETAYRVGFVHNTETGGEE